MRLVCKQFVALLRFVLSIGGGFAPSVGRCLRIGRSTLGLCPAGQTRLGAFKHGVFALKQTGSALGEQLAMGTKKVTQLPLVPAQLFGTPTATGRASPCGGTRQGSRPWRS